MRRTVRRRWSINGRFLSQPVTGVQRYAREILTALDQLVREGGPLVEDLHLDIIVPADADPPTLEAIEVCRTASRGGHLWEQATLPTRLDGGLLSLCNTGPIAASRQIVCVHDMNTRLVPGSYSTAFRLVYRVLIPALGRRARAIASVSHFSASQMARFGVAAEQSIAIIPNGSGHALRWQARHTDVTRAAAGPGTIVLLGSTAPHKNIELILGLASRLRDAGLHVAVVGSRNDRVFQATGAVSDPAIMWLGRLDDSALAALLADSLCLAFPSLTEGFGLPPLEAMAIGCPVVVSREASMPEVCGRAALYASPYDPEAWFDAFLRLRNRPDERTALVALGRAQAALFDWRQSAELYLRLMARIDGVALPEASAPHEAAGLRSDCAVQ